MGVVRLLFVVALVIASGSLGGSADASCIPEDLPARAARAETVVHARAVAPGGPALGAPSRFAHFEVLRVLKGSAPARIAVALGPDVPAGPPGTVAATSVDYTLRGEAEHTLFLRRSAAGGFATDACAGSHPGAPTSEEVALFGRGTAPEPVPGGVAGATSADRIVAGVATLVALAAAIAAIAYARRGARGPAAP